MRWCQSYSPSVSSCFHPTWRELGHRPQLLEPVLTLKPLFSFHQNPLSGKSVGMTDTHLQPKSWTLQERRTNPESMCEYKAAKLHRKCHGGPKRSHMQVIDPIHTSTIQQRVWPAYALASLAYGTMGHQNMPNIPCTIRWYVSSFLTKIWLKLISKVQYYHNSKP